MKLLQLSKISCLIIIELETFHSKDGTSSSLKSQMKSILLAGSTSRVSLIRISPFASLISTCYLFLNWLFSSSPSRYFCSLASLCAFSRSLSLSSWLFSNAFYFSLMFLDSMSPNEARGIVIIRTPVIYDRWIFDLSTKISSSNFNWVIFPFTSILTYSGCKSQLTRDVSMNLGSHTSNIMFVLSVDSENKNS